MVIRSFLSRWTGLVEMKVWMRGRSAFLIASHARSMSPGLVRHRAAIDGPLTDSAIASTPAKSPSLAAGKPASITSTPSLASWTAISSFSDTDSAMPGACSPSRNVVSRMITRLLSAGGTLRSGWSLTITPYSSAGVQIFSQHSSPPDAQLTRLIHPAGQPDVDGRTNGSCTQRSPTLETCLPAAP